MKTAALLGKMAELTSPAVRPEYLALLNLGFGRYGVLWGAFTAWDANAVTDAYGFLGPNS